MLLSGPTGSAALTCYAAWLRHHATTAFRRCCDDSSVAALHGTYLGVLAPGRIQHHQRVLVALPVGQLRERIMGEALHRAARPQVRLLAKSDIPLRTL